MSIRSRQPTIFSIEDNVIIVDTLPVANVSQRYKRVILRGAAGTKDKYYICLKSDSDLFNWIEIVNGGV